MWSFLCLLFIIRLWPTYTNAQITDRGGLRAITLSHGLSDLLVNQIYKDSDGYVWFGTESSVDRFDGNQIMRLPIPADRHKSRRVLCFAETPDKTLYVGTNQGLYAIMNGSRRLIPIYPDKLNGNINTICSGGDHQLFIGTSSGLYIYNPQKKTLLHKLLVDDNLSERNEIKGLWYQGNSILWLLTPHRIWSMNLEMDQTTAYQLPVSSVSTRLCEIHKVLYAGTDGNGVIPFDIDKLAYGKPISVGNDIVTTLSATPDNELLIGTDGEGIYIYSLSDGEVTDHITASPESTMQLRSNSVYSALKDAQGLLWVGYYQSGVDYTPQQNYVPESILMPKELGVTQNVVRSLERTEGYTIVGTHEGLVLIDDTTGKARKYSTPEISSNLIMSLKEQDGKIYVGTYHGGMYRLDPKTGIITRFGPSELYDQSIFQFDIDKNGNLWSATSLGLYKFNDEQGKNYEVFTSKNSQLPSGNVYEIYFDSLGRGWIGTENGLAIWNGQYVQTSGFPQGFIDKMKIRVVYEDRDHRLYFAPDRGVIWVSDLSMKNFFALEESDEERFSQIPAIIEDHDGWIWIGTDKGLISFNKKDPAHFQVFNHIGGVANPVYTLARPYLDPNGDLWFGSTTGLHRVNFEKVKKEREEHNHAPLIISDIESGGKSLINLVKDGERDYSILLNEDQRDLTLNVTDLSYEYRDFFEVEYNVEKKGVENEWRWANGAEPIKINELPNDSFTLNIKLAGEPESQINLKIKRQKVFPWWWIGGSILIILLIISTYYYKHKREIKRIKSIDEEKSEKNTALLVQKEPKQFQSSQEEKLSYRTTRISDEECKRLIKKLDNIMKTEKPFKNPDLKIKDLAEMIDANAHSLSFLFNQFLDKSYYDYVNEYRVNEFKELVKNIDTSRYTITTMAEKCGFSSRASFFRHFKNLTGMTPSEYLKKTEKGEARM